MKIADYNIQNKSAHQIGTSHEVSEKLTVWNGPRSQGPVAVQPIEEEPSYKLEIGSLRDSYEFISEKAYLNNDLRYNSNQMHDYDAVIKLKLIETFIFQTTGKQVKLTVPKLDIDERSGEVELPSKQEVDQPLGWGVEYEYREVHEEQENVAFRSAGTVTTKDGQKFNFDLTFNMSRTYYEENNVSIRMGDAAKIDPLVVVLNNLAPTLSKTKHDFDLDGDGKTEQISFPTEGSGFLALDKNADGIINDGMELFGPQTGDGFMALRAYDVDNNDWIDENDPVFGKLSMFSLGKNGQTTLFKLGDVGIGAIYLNETETPFDMKDNADEYGEIKSSAVYLKEDGSAGTIHHIDLEI